MEDLDAVAAAELDQAARHFAEQVTQCTASARFAPASGDVLQEIATHLPLSSALRHWYRSAATPASSITIRQLGNDCTIYSPGDLVENQLGYRWYSDPSQEDPQPLEGWLPEWVVIGDIGADPIIADTHLAGTPILSAMHGEGEWDPHLMAPTLARYLEAWARWIEICLIRTGAADIQNWTVAYRLIWQEQRGEYLPHVKEALVRSLGEVLPDDCLIWWT